MAARKFRITKGNSGKSGVAKAAKGVVRAASKQRVVSKTLTPRGELVEQIKKQQRSASAKITRGRKKGYEIAGTGYDPRIDISPSAIDRMDMRQLRAASKKLAQFNDRKTQFVAGAAGIPIPAEDWKRYKATEWLVNRRNLKRMETRGGLRTPHDDMTLAQRQAMLQNSDFPHMEGGYENPYNLRNRESWQIRNAEALDKLIKANERVLRKGHLANEIKSAKQSLYKMVDEFGDAELSKMVRSLTNNQVDIFWFDYNYAKELVPSYAQAKMLAARGKDAEIAIALEDDLDDVRKAFEWAKNLPRVSSRKS